MAKKVFNMEGGLHSANAYTAFEAKAYGSCVASQDSLKVSAGSGMVVKVSAGDGIIDGQTPRRVQIDQQETLNISPASTSYNRKDLVVIYVDNSVSPTTNVVDNVNNILKLAVISGTPSAVPATPSDSEIKAKIGATSNYMILAEILVQRNSSTITQNVIKDTRKVITIIPVASLGGKLTNENIDFGSFPIQYGGGGLAPGTVSKTFTPKSDGLLRVVAGGRRNAGNAADLVIYISATGVENQRDSTGVQYGTGVFASASFVAQVRKGVPVTISINTAGGSIANSGYQFFVIPGKVEFIN